jgi:hypothetical protein
MMKKDHNGQAIIKSTIIKCILEENAPVSEPDIRKNLEEKGILKNQSTINRHLHDLSNFGFIELVPPLKLGLRNKWDISKLEHLRNINRCSQDDKILQKIELNVYEKSLMIILLKSNHTVCDPVGLYFFICLRLSPSLFDKCLGVSIEELFNNAFELFQCREGIKDLFKDPKSREAKIVLRGDSGSGKTNLALRLLYENIGTQSYDSLLKHFLDHDILDGVDSPEEREFVEKTRQNHINYFLSLENDKDSSFVINNNRFKEYLFKDLNLISIIMAKYKQPSIFKNEIYTNINELYNALKDFYFSNRD